MTMTAITTVEDQGVERVLNCLPSQGTEDDWRPHHADQAGLLAAAAPLPEEVDLRVDRWWKVGDQGSTGSCVGWATADSVLRWHLVQAGRLAEQDRLSPRFTWMASKETDEFTSQPSTFVESAGTSLKAALTVSRRYGAVRDGVLPFDPPRLYAGEAATLYAMAARRRIDAYFNLGRSADEWRRWLATNGPILTRLDVDDTWMHVGKDGKLASYDASSRSGGHAVALVGYRADGFIVRNSWGTGWGDGGFAYASPSYAAEAFTEAYGVTA